MMRPDAGSATYVEKGGEEAVKYSPTRADDDYSMIASANPFISQLNAMMRLGFERPLQDTDLGTCPPDVRKEYLIKRLNAALDSEKAVKEDRRSIWRLIFKTIGVKRVLLGVLFGLLGGSAAFAGPLLLKAITNHIQGTAPLAGGKTELWVLIALTFVVPVLGSMAVQESNMLANYIAVQLRSVLTGAIFAKITRTRVSDLQTGLVVNMANVDVRTLEMLPNVIRTLLTIPCMIVVCLALVYQEVGVSMFVGVAYTAIVIPLSGLGFAFIGKLFRERLATSDKRLKMTNEIFTGIRVLKFYSWEKAFISAIEALRDVEQALQRRVARILAVVFFLQQSVPLLLPVIIFSTYVGLGHELHAVQAFVVIQFLQILQGPIMMLANVGSTLSSGMASAARVVKFLCADELIEYVAREPPGDDAEGPAIEMHRVSLGWSLLPAVAAEAVAVAFALRDGEHAGLVATTADKGYQVVSSSAGEDKGEEKGEVDTDKGKEGSTAAAAAPAAAAEPAEAESIGPDCAVHTLTDVSLTVPRGSLLCVVGPIGSGKSSLLSSLLDELCLHSGSIKVRGRLGYHQQSAWIFNASIRDNILFGRAFDQELFDSACRASALNADVAAMPDGWDTEIGEKGINLSGGQKARVGFARVLYSDADVFLLDDPLSAVDPHVGNVLFYEGIKGLQARGKTVVLVTHQTQYLKDCDHILILEEGRVKASGSYKALSSSGIDVTAFVAAPPPAAAPASAASAAEGEGGDKEKPAGPGPGPAAVKGGERGEGGGGGRGGGGGGGRGGGRGAGKDGVGRGSGGGGRGGVINGGTGTGLMTAEKRDKGSIRWKTYWYYVSRGHPIIYVAMLVVTLGSQALLTYANVWLSIWGTASLAGLSARENFFYLGRYSLFVVFGSFSTFVNMNLNLEHRTKAAKVIHLELMTKILSASMSFFDTTPLGRIMNIFSSDVRQVDLMIGMSVAMLLSAIGQLTGNIGVLGYTTSGTFLLALIPLGFLYTYFQRYYQTTNLELKRLDCTANSPIVIQFTETLHGITSIRAFDSQQRYTDDLDRYVLHESTVFSLLALVDCWKQVRLDVIGATMSLFVYLLAASTDSFISTGLLLVAITYSNVLPGLCSMLVSVLSNVESAFNSVDRIMHYQEDIKFESDVVPEGATPALIPDDWPSEGVIVAKDIVVGYRDGPDVLKGVSFELKAREKVGVVGRTGSGKSTLMLSLFRFENLREGTLSIDGIDLARVPLHILRSRLGLVPQDAVLWNQTLRFNLDPFSAYSDEEIWAALEAVCLKDAVSALDGKLLFGVSENGSNFSQGQKQLLCFARCLLKRPRVLVLDEATAAVDAETDALVQQMIRERFRDATVLSIAHRLNTVLDFDRIAVLDDGRLRELDSAEALLRVEGGVFAALHSKFVLSHAH